MFRIKICGLTNIEDAQQAADAGADAIGLNFYPASKRYVTPATALRIAQAVPPEIVRVGVFVNTPIEGIREVVENGGVGLDMIQLHGDETPDFLLGLSRILSLPVIRAFRLTADGTGSMGRYLEQCGHLGCTPRMILIDADQPGSYGGTGQTADWTAVGNLPQKGLPPVVLAGGLTPDNVADAIATARPAAVDVAGGVESGPGRKDAAMVRAFIRAAQSALGAKDADRG